MKSILCVLAALLLGVWAAVDSASAEAPTGINAPGGKTVTVATEIGRGSKAVWDVPSFGTVGEFSLRYGEVTRLNEQQNTDSEGFMMGARYQAWMSLWILMRALPQTTNEGMPVAESFFTDFRKKQKEMGISDEDFAAAVRMKADKFKQAVAGWEARKK